MCDLMAKYGMVFNSMKMTRWSQGIDYMNCFNAIAVCGKQVGFATTIFSPSWGLCLSFYIMASLFSIGSSCPPLSKTIRIRLSRYLKYSSVYPGRTLLARTKIYSPPQRGLCNTKKKSSVAKLSHTSGIRYNLLLSWEQR